MSYRICACLLGVFAIGGCGAPIGQPRADSVSIFRQAIDARNRGDIDGLMNFFARARCEKMDRAIRHA